MARYILIDNGTGYIFGDTADYMSGNQSGITPIDAARALDTTIGEHHREYVEINVRSLASNETGYHVYRADIDGSEAVPVVWDGQDPDTIATVETACRYVTTIRCYGCA